MSNNEDNEINIFNIINGNHDSIAEITGTRGKDGDGRFGSRGKDGDGRFGTRGKDGDGRFGTRGKDGDGRFGTRGKDGDGRFGTRGKDGDGRFGTRGKDGDGRFGTRGKDGDGRFGTRGKDGDGRFGTRGKDGDGRFGTRGKDNDGRFGTRGNLNDDTIVNIYNIVNTGSSDSTREFDDEGVYAAQFLGYDDVKREAGKPIGLSCHIGVNELDVDHYGTKGLLVACENDAEDMQAIADSKNYQSVLFNTFDAVRSNVETAIESAAAMLEPGDIFFLTYAGHGSQVRDVTKDEKDGLDETWCLHDAQQIDDERRYLFSKFKQGVRVLVVSDSCHSETTSRVLLATPDSNNARAIDDKTVVAPRHAFRALEADVAVRAYQGNQDFYDELNYKAARDIDNGKVKARVKTLSACKDEQLASDGRFNGLFTEMLKQTYNDGKYTDNYQSFINQISKLVSKQSHNDQQPRMDDQGYADEGFDNQAPFEI